MPISTDQKLLGQFEQLIRRDPARRGLIGTEQEFGPLCPGHLSAAAADLAQHAASVGIVTGFFIPRGNPAAAETDGPLGALFLADILEKLGIETWLATDEHCHRALLAAAHAMEFPAERIYHLSIRERSCCEIFFNSLPGHRCTHLIAVERVGPSHTSESLAQQPRKTQPPLEEFSRHVPLACRNRCHNMRGEAIDDFSGNLHQLFEFVQEFCPDVKTIGIGDGANEIGMGSIPWEDLHRRLEGDHAAMIPCRISTDWTIISGTSNWGGYALAAGVAHLKERAEILRPLDAAQQLHTLEQMVAHGPAVDGVTRRREATVDGLPFATYIQPLDGMRRALGFTS